MRQTKIEDYAEKRASRSPRHEKNPINTQDQINDKLKNQLKNLKQRTDFGDMKLWIITDDKYSDLRQADGCGSFSDLQTTQADANQIQKLGKLLGIQDKNVKVFRGSEKKQLNDFYTTLKREYTALIKKTERVFLLVYCAGHGVTQNCKQVYVLNSSSDATFNIEYKLRMLADKFNSFLHVFAIYDVCHSGMRNLPELMAVRGKNDSKKRKVDSDDSQGNRTFEQNQVPYFHISSERPSQGFGGEASFAEQCLEFAKDEARRNQGLIEFPGAWAKKFKQIQDPGKPYWLKLNIDLPAKPLRTLSLKLENIHQIPGKNKVANDLPRVLNASAIEEPVSCSRLETVEDSGHHSYADMVLETDFGSNPKDGSDPEHVYSYNPQTGGMTERSLIEREDGKNDQKRRSEPQAETKSVGLEKRRKPSNSKTNTSTSTSRWAPSSDLEIQSQDESREYQVFCCKFSCRKCLCAMVILMLLLLLVASGWILVMLYQRKSFQHLCQSPLLINLYENQNFQTTPASYFYEGNATFSINPFEVTPSQCPLTFSCVMRPGPLNNLCNFQDENTHAAFNSETGEYTFRSTDLMAFGTQKVQFEITATSGNSEGSYSFELNLVNPCLISEFSIDPDIISREISYNIYHANEALQISLDPSLVTQSHQSSLCPPYQLNILVDESTLPAGLVFEYDTDSKLLKIDTNNPLHAGSYDLKVVASYEGSLYTQTDEHSFTVNLVDYCADSVVTNPGQASTTVPYDYYYSGTTNFELVPFTVQPAECDIIYSCIEQEYGLCNYFEGTTRSMFVPETGKFAFTSKDIDKFGTQTISFTIVGQAERSGTTKKEEKWSESSVDIDICFVLNGQNSCDTKNEQQEQDPSVAKFTFDLNLVDPCEIAEISIDQRIIAENIYYGIYDGNFPTNVLISKDMVIFEPTSSHCPDLVLDVLNSDGSQITDKMFKFDSQTSELWIESSDIADVGHYKLKLVARFDSERYTQQSEVAFNVLLIDYCASATLISPGSNQLSIDYNYQGTAVFEGTLFEVSPKECQIQYSCFEPVYGLCNLQTPKTQATFSQETSGFSFATDDFETFGTQSIEIQITGKTSSSQQTFNLTISMIDPCLQADIELKDGVIQETVYYPIMAESRQEVVQINTGLISISTEASICPEVRLDVQNQDGTPLQRGFTYDSVKDQLLIDTDDVTLAGDYSLVLVAFFDGEKYTQTSRVLFQVSMADFHGKQYFEYDKLSLLEFPARQQWPEQQQTTQIPQQNLTLSEVRYKHKNNKYQMSSVQLVFENGVISPLLEATNAKYSDTSKSFKIDPSREIRYVRMATKYGVYFNAMWFLDDDYQTIAKEVWRSSGQWHRPQEIPKGQHIIGVKADTAACDSCIQAVSFLLGEIGKPGIVGELRFPELQVTPTPQQFYQIQFEDSLSQLNRLYYKMYKDATNLSGLQLGFVDGSKSALIQSENAVNNELRSIDIDTSRKIHAVSMLVYQGRNFEGLRLYDDKMDLILDLTWDSQFAGEWTPVQIVPEGQRIIGVKGMAHYEHYLRHVTFILGPDALFADQQDKTKAEDVDESSSGNMVSPTDQGDSTGQGNDVNQSGQGQNQSGNG